MSTTDAWKSSMRELRLRSCDIYNNMQQLTTALKMCTSLHTLDISGNAVMAHEVVPLLQHMRLRALDISDNSISDFGMRALLPLAMQSNMLSELHVDGNHITRHSLRLLRKMRKAKGTKITMPRASCLCDICHGP
jgi:Ran GTPase-activating protein (RanGAP) involved in mRNA processing and transport